MDRGFQVGSVVGLVAGLVQAGVVTSRRYSARNLRTVAAVVLNSTGACGMLGLTAIGLTGPVYMAGKEPIEWQDRSWRLLENKGQVDINT